MEAISLWSSFSNREVRLSGPAALPGLSFESCFDCPFTLKLMLDMVGEGSIQQGVSFLEGQVLFKTDWNLVFKIFALCEALYVLHHLISDR